MIKELDLAISDHTGILEEYSVIYYVSENLDLPPLYIPLMTRSTWTGDDLTAPTCIHDNCSTCHGSVIGPYGTCVHMISCPCPKCTPIYSI